MFSLKKNREGRNHPRWRIDRFLAIYDQDKSVFLGRIDDLSVSGMCVLSSETLPLDRHIKLALEVLDENGNEDTIYLRCRSLWSRETAEGSGLFRIGFEFSGVSPAVIGEIERLIRQHNLSASGRRPGEASGPF